MKSIAQVIAAFLFLCWPLWSMMSVMLVGAPGASNRFDSLLPAFLVASYPIAIGVFFYQRDWNLYFVPPWLVLVLSCAGPAFGLYLYGAALLNLLRGIQNEGYTVTADAVYLDARPVPGADAKSFQVLAPSYPQYGRDARQVFAAHAPIVGADAPSFELLEDGYARDAAHAYYFEQAIDGADAASFAVIGRRTDADGAEYDARDARRRYLQGHGL